MGQQAQDSSPLGWLIFESHYYYRNKSEIEHDGSFRAAVITYICKMIEDEETQDIVIEELNMYQDQQGSFGHDIAIRQRRNKNFNPG